MFTWTPGSVLAALDAGIAEVAHLFNVAYAIGAASPFIGPAHGKAHEFALFEVAYVLNTLEAERRERAVTNLLATLGIAA